MEKWRDALEYEGIYQVSNTGLVRSLDRSIVQTNGVKISSKGRSLRLYTHYLGYIRTSFCVMKNRKYHYVHRLVYEAFKGKLPEGLEINHIDGVKANNNLDNLEAVTRAANIRHAYRNGLNSPKLGEESFLSKLTEAEVLDIRNTLSHTIGVHGRHINLKKEVAQKYNISTDNINRILRRDTWKHI